jgi:hypothetical protein
VTGYGLDRRGSITGRDKRFSRFHSVHTGSEALPASYQISFGANLPGLETDNSPPSSAEAKNDGAVTPLPHTSS